MGDWGCSFKRVNKVFVLARPVFTSYLVQMVMAQLQSFCSTVFGSSTNKFFFFLTFFFSPSWLDQHYITPSFAYIHLQWHHLKTIEILKPHELSNRMWSLVIPLSSSKIMTMLKRCHLSGKYNILLDAQSNKFLWVFCKVCVSEWLKHCTK